MNANRYFRVSSSLNRFNGSLVRCPFSPRFLSQTTAHRLLTPQPQIESSPSIFSILSDNSFRSLVNASSRSLSNYRLLREIGTGTFASVREAVDLETQKRVAVKIMNKKRCGRLMCENEIRVLDKVTHKLMTPALAVFEDRTNLYIVLELLTGGELFDLVLERGRLSEPEVAQMCRKLVYALESLHASGILHRDIKLENLVLIGGDGGKLTDFKLIDFGLALDSEHNQVNTSLPAASTSTTTTTSAAMVGTLGYCAPEVLGPQRVYSTASDVWSCGVVCYILLSGEIPFPWESHESDTLETKISKELEAILKARSEKEWRKTFSTAPWNTISKEAKLLLSKMLEVNPQKRITTSSILNDPFILRHTRTSEIWHDSFE